MEPNDSPPTHEDSLRIIQSMIETARKQISDNGFHLLWWGWLVLVASLLHYGLAVGTDFEYPHFAWLLTVPGAVVSFVYGYRHGRRSRTTSYTDRLVVWVWVAVIVSLVILQVFMVRVNYQITPLVLLLAGNGAFVTGWLIRFRPVRLGGTALWGSAVAAFLVPTIDQLLVMAVAIVLGYLIPGYRLRAQYRKQ